MYDNIIQSIDYGFLQYIITHDDISNNFFINVFKNMNAYERLFMINSRKKEDLFMFLSNNKINKFNCDKYGIDIQQRSKEYFKDVIVSNFAMKLPILLANGSVDKLLVALDTNNANKLTTLVGLFSDYMDKISIIGDADHIIDKYIKKREINTVVLTDDVAYRNIDELYGKSVMIMDTESIYDEYDAGMVQAGLKAKITKHKWEERNDLTITFLKPYKFDNIRKAEII